MRLSHDVPTRLCRVLFTVLMAVAWTRAPAAAAEPAAASSPGHDHGQPAEPLTPEQRKKAAATLDRALRLVDAMDREGPRDTFDVKAVVASAGRDPVKLFEWVRDRTHWVCYAGALRGPVGVLMDRVGNSLDRSLLLAELLRNAGHKVRLMRAELTAEQAQALLAKTRPLPEDWAKGPDATSADASGKRLAELARRFAIDPELLKRSGEKSAARTAKASEEAARRVADQAPAVAEAVNQALAGRAGGDRPSSEGDPAAELADHWWVARQEGGAWVDWTR